MAESNDRSSNGQNDQKDSTASSSFRAAVRLIRKREYDKAIIVLQQILEDDPNDAKAHNALGSIYCALDLTDKGIAEFTKAVESDPEYYAQPHLNLSTIFYRKSVKGGLTKEFNRMIEIDAHYGVFGRNLGLLLWFCHPKHVMPAYINAGAAWADRSWLEETFAELDSSLETDPNNGLIHLQIGLVCYVAGNLDLAEKHGKIASELRVPSNVSGIHDSEIGPRYLLDNIKEARKTGSLRGGDLPDSVLRSYLEENPEWAAEAVPNEEVEEKLSGQKDQETVAVGERAAVLFIDNAGNDFLQRWRPFFEELGANGFQVLLQFREWSTDEDAEKLNAVFQEGPPYLARGREGDVWHSAAPLLVLINVGTSRCSSAKLQLVMHDFDHMIRGGATLLALPPWTGTLNWVLECLRLDARFGEQKLKDDANSLGFLKKDQVTFTNIRSHLLTRGVTKICYGPGGGTSISIASADRKQKIEPLIFSSPTANVPNAPILAIAPLGSGHVIMFAGNQTFASSLGSFDNRQLLKNVLAFAALNSTKITRAAVFIDKGISEFKKGNIDVAMEQYAKAIETDPNSSEGHCNLGIGYAKQGSTDEAVREFQRALESDPYLSMAHEGLAESFLKKDDADNAVKEYTTVLELRPNDAEVLMRLGIVYATKKASFEQAAAMFEQCLDLNQNWVMAHLNLAAAYSDLAKLDKAWEHIRIAEKLNAKEKETKPLVTALKERSSEELYQLWFPPKRYFPSEVRPLQAIIMNLNADSDDPNEIRSKFELLLKDPEAHYGHGPKDFSADNLMFTPRFLRERHKLEHETLKTVMLDRADANDRDMEPLRSYFSEEFDLIHIAAYNKTMLEFLKRELERAKDGLDVRDYAHKDDYKKNVESYKRLVEILKKCLALYDSVVKKKTREEKELFERLCKIFRELLPKSHAFSYSELKFAYK